MTPRTLQEAIIYFSDFDNCQKFMIEIRWPDGKVKCPYCQSEKVTYLPSGKVWRCAEKHARRKFSLKVGTVFEDSPIGLDKWFCAMWLVVNCKNGVSSYEIARDLKVTQKTAWFMDHRIRLAMQSGSFEKASSEFEVDESFIGGLARNMHKNKKEDLSPFERLKRFARAIVAVPKAEIVEQEAEYQRKRKRLKEKAAPKGR